MSKDGLGRRDVWLKVPGYDQLSHIKLLKGFVDACPVNLDYRDKFPRKSIIETWAWPSWKVRYTNTTS